MTETDVAKTAGAKSGKTDPGRFFEDYRLGEVIQHATPRTITDGDVALYTALYPTRFALYASEVLAHGCGLPGRPVEELIAFHTVFGKTVPDISINAIANLGYAEGRFLAPVYSGETLSASSEVIGLRETSKGDAGVVWVRTTGLNQRGRAVLRYVRWVLVRKRDAASPAPEPVVPELAPALTAEDLAVPFHMHFRAYDAPAAGSPHLWADYEVGEKIDHADCMTMEESEHMMATRLWQNTAKVHFSTAARGGQPRLIYGGHIISLARALSFNGLANAQMIAGINAGTHVAPCFAGDTIHAWSEVLDKAETTEPTAGALRIRTVAVKNRPAADFPLRDADGKYAEGVVLDFDYWVFMPR
ncbi:MaoC family dehydratase [Paralimibaculum aggregatum]|uniref:MaoC family dehydratase n=1 Tax=Paralimibaculum aggregatum TaxID=3036245 RepID=A0ABQ6LM03_9RHOB|nr:MaoC family dehydratase [Limibaculum sp. NKW23]GMG83315.1 MaoC family dehydratase [Limibaculum sp. NKW23]